MSVPTFDYYRILGLTKDATSEDGACMYILFPLLVLNFEHWTVRRAYKQKVLETHPDKIPPDSTEEEKDAAREQFSKVRC
jgi:curved DNA-binding protein CbpA